MCLLMGDGAGQTDRKGIFLEKALGLEVGIGPRSS